MINSDLYFLQHGIAEIVCPVDPRQNPEEIVHNSVPVAKLPNGEIFGESGFINLKFPTSKKITEKLQASSLF